MSRYGFSGEVVEEEPFIRGRFAVVIVGSFFVWEVVG